MSNPWGAPDHTNPVHGPQHHAAPNPTQSSPDLGLLGGGTGAGGWQAPPVMQDPRLVAQYADYRFLWVAILLAFFLGPLGVFYVGFFSGVGASVLVVAAGRTLFSALTAATGVEAWALSACGSGSLQRGLTVGRSAGNVARSCGDFDPRLFRGATDDSGTGESRNGRRSQ